MSTNVSSEVRGNLLILTIDLSKRLGPSSSGKTVLIAKGSEKVAGKPGVGFSLSAYAKE
jgi:hypothetical protein